MENLDIQQKIDTLELENRKLRTAVEELSVLNDIATAITSTQSVGKIVELMVQKCVKHLKVEQGAVMLLNEEDQDRPLRTMVRKKDSVSEFLPLRLDAQITGWVLKNKSPLLVKDLKTDERFNRLESDEFPVNSLISVPITIKGKMIGLLTVFNKRFSLTFSEDDQRLLSIIAAQSAHVIENARLYQEEQSLIRMQEEMRLATDIQTNLLPKTNPKIEGYQIIGNSVPAKEVGGDYFDFIPVNDSELVFCLADISGKGIPAALLMANLQATLRGQSRNFKQCKNCIDISNTLVFQSTDSQKFATLFYGRLNYKTHELTYCNAGHDKPVLIDASGNIKRLTTGGIVLGFLEKFDYEDETILFEAGSTLVIYSDGISEAMNSQEEDFGEERLVQLIQENYSKPANEIITVILTAIKKHAAGAMQMDDETLVVIKRDS